ncbi:hypothetical protein Tco_0796871 [Tanacetum coccineum]
MESVKKSIDERAQHKHEIGTKSKEQDTSNRSRNDTHADDADIRPIYDEEPMAKVQTTAEINIFATGQQHTEQPEFNNEGNVDQNSEQCHDTCTDTPYLHNGYGVLSFLMMFGVIAALIDVNAAQSKNKAEVEYNDMDELYTTSRCINQKLKGCLAQVQAHRTWLLCPLQITTLMKLLILLMKFLLLALKLMLLTLQILIT